MKKARFFVLIILVLLVSACTHTAVTTTILTTGLTSTSSSSTTATTLSTATTRSGAYQAHYNDVPLDFTKEDQYGVYYEIFVRSFADSNGDGIGDFNGITAKIPYLKQLGIDGIWLMPVLESPSYHGYDVIDYYKLQSEYGTEADFENMIQTAHDNGIKVIMDLVVNHTSSQNEWFIQSENYPNGKYGNYYTWINQDDPRVHLSGSWGQPIWYNYAGDYYCGYFGGAMPDLNYLNPDVQTEVINIGKYWMNKGLDGFRLDAAMHIYGQNEYPADVDYRFDNIDWWHTFRKALQQDYPDVYLVSEVSAQYGTVSPYFRSVQSSFNFDVANLILTDVNQASANGYSNRVGTILNTYKEYNPNFIDAPFLSNHDQNRVASVLNDLDKEKLAADMLFMLSGNPYIYYGEEIGMKGAKPDPIIRLPFKWTDDGSGMDTFWESSPVNNALPSEEDQMNDPNSLLTHYINLIQLRKDNIALEKGDFIAYDVDGFSGPAYLKYYNDGSTEQLLLVLHNLSSRDAQIDLNPLTFSRIVYNSSPSSNYAVISGRSTLVLEVKPDRIDTLINYN